MIERLRGRNGSQYVETTRSRTSGRVEGVRFEKWYVGRSTCGPFQPRFDTCRTIINAGESAADARWYGGVFVRTRRDGRGWVIGRLGLRMTSSWLWWVTRPRMAVRHAVWVVRGRPVVPPSTTENAFVAPEHDARVGWESSDVFERSSYDAARDARAQRAIHDRIDAELERQRRFDPPIV